jgi:hypothetical protein
MRATDRGIELNKAELAALLAFCGDDSKYGVVHFRINASGKLIASASDGKRAIECTSEGLAQRGEWRCERSLIEACRRLTDAGESSVILRVTEKGLREVLIVAIADQSELGRYKVASDAVSTQVTMDAIHGEIGGTAADADIRLKGSWFALGVKSLVPMAAVEKAANGCPVSLFPPKNPTSLVRFEAKSEGGTWVGVVAPITVRGPGDEAETDDEDPAPPGTESGSPPPLKLSAPLATEKKRKAKATKKTGKKPALKALPGGKAKKKAATPAAPISDD